MDPQLDSNIAQLQSLPVLTREQMTQLNNLLMIKLNLAIAEITNLRVEISRLHENNEDNQQTIQCLLTNDELITTADNGMDIATSQLPATKEADSANSNDTRTNKRKLNPTTAPVANKKPLTARSQQSGPDNTPDDSENSCSDSESIIADPNPTGKKASKIPPIILRTKTNTLHILNELKKEGVTIKDAVNRSDCIKIHVESPKDFRQTTKHFDTKKIPYHTYQLAEEKLLKVVIRGIPEDIDPKEVLEELQRLNYPAISATRMKSGPNRKAIPLILVQLTKPEGKEIFNLSQILYLRVRVESLRRKTEVTQCHKCQKFGHGAKNCHVPPRCVKCAGAHHTSLCTKPKNTAAKCANCGDAHTASYRGCPAAPKRQQSRHDEPQQQQPRHDEPQQQRSFAAPQHTNQTQYKPRNINLSYSQAASQTKPPPPSLENVPTPVSQANISSSTVITLVKLLTQLITAIPNEEKTAVLNSITNLK